MTYPAHISENNPPTPSALEYALNAGRTTISGRDYMNDTKGGFTPVEVVRPEHKLEDETVRRVMFYARDLSEQIARFKSHTFEDLSAFQSLLEQEYGARKGGKKGNVTYMSHDGLMKIQVQIADQITFGPELQTAKALLDECLVEWGAESGPEIRALVNRVFSVEKEGEINRSELFGLLRMDIADERWKRSMEAIRNSIRVVGTKSYLRFYTRANAEAGWTAITIDIANA